MSIILHGVTTSKDIAIDRAHLITRGTAGVPQYDINPDKLEAEVARFDNAIKATRKELEQLCSAIPKNAPIGLGVFISLHLVLLTDVTLLHEPVDTLCEQRINAEWALKLQSDKLAVQLNNIDGDYPREHKQGMLQAVHHIHNNLVGQSNELNLAGNLFDDTVLITYDLSPIDIVLFKKQHITAFVTDTGGPTDHTAILGRSLDVPSVIGLHNTRKLITENEIVIVDGISGTLIIDPDEVVLNGYRRLTREYRSRKCELNKIRRTTATTADGTNIELLVNTESAENIKALHNFDTNGAGLFRSEFPYLNHGTILSKDEQYEVYSAIVKKMKDKSITIRAVDLGADKNPRWFGQNSSPNGSFNPALSLASIRLCLAEPIIFRTQMRAILHAVIHSPVHIMWPMIISISEVRQYLIHLDTARRQLAERDKVFGPISIGCMAGIPSTAMAVGSTLKLVDLVSVGINDLIQYLLSVDRDDDSVSHPYQLGHPTIPKTLQHIIHTANRMEKGISICSEMAGDTVFTRLLLGMGLRRFSVSPNNPLSVKNITLRSHTGHLENDAAKTLRCEGPEKTEKLIKILGQGEQAESQAA